MWMKNATDRPKDARASALSGVLSALESADSPGAADCTLINHINAKVSKSRISRDYRISLPD